MGRWWRKGGQANDANGQEEVPLEAVETSAAPPNPDGPSEKAAQKPMSGVMEALFFGSGGQYASVDDCWDPLEEDQDEGDDIPIGDSLKMMEISEDQGERSGTELPDQIALQPEPEKPPFDMENFYADIRERENIISDLRSKQNRLEHQLRTLSKEENTNAVEALSKKSALEEELKQVKEQIMTEADRLDQLMVSARKEVKAQEEAKKKKKTHDMPKPKPAKDAGPEDLRTCRRGYIPHPEPLDKGQVKPEPTPKMVKVTTDVVEQFGASKWELPEKKDHLRARVKELQDLTDAISEYDRATTTMIAISPDTVDTTQKLHSAPKTGHGTSAPKATNENINGLRKYQVKLREKCDRLSNEIETIEKDLPNLRQIIEKDAKVTRARRNYNKDKTNFTNSIFQSIQYGRLDDLAAMTAALDMEDVSITNLHDEKSKYSPIHMALMRDQHDIVEFLLKHSGKDMAMNTVETEECDKLTPFYIAVQHGKVKNVQLLLDVLTPEERQKCINTKVHNKAYEKTYYNELPLAAGLWSAAGSSDLTEISAMLDCLVQNGAQLDMKTDDGENTILHLLVAQSCQSVEHMDYFRNFLTQPFTKAAGIWYSEFHSEKRKLPVKVAQVRGMKALFSIKNKDELTPITLAAKLESPLYADLINWKDVMRFPDPKLGQQLSNLDVYDVTNVTSLKYVSGKGLLYNRNSVMHVLAHNNVDITVWDEDISTIEPLKAIISQKWQLYQLIFYLWGFIHLAYMSAFTGIVFGFGPKNVLPVQRDEYLPNPSNSSNESSVKVEAQGSGYYRLVKGGNPWFLLFSFLPLVYIIFEIIDHCSGGLGRMTYKYSLTGNALYRIISVIFSIFTLIWTILQMVENVNQDIILSLALLFGWLFGILFTRTINFPDRSSQIGAFSIMVQRMLFHDLFPFVIVSFFIVIAFSTAIHATLLNSEESKTEGVKFRITLFNMLKYYSALDDAQDYTSSREKEFAKAVLSVYGIISVVLLINMLIAAMNKTYDMVRATHTDLVVRQRLAILLMLERRLPFQWLRERSEAKFEMQKQERFLQVVSIKGLAPLSTKGVWNWFGTGK